MRIKLPGQDERDTTLEERAALEVDYCETHLESVDSDRWARAWQKLSDLFQGAPKAAFAMLRWASINAKYVVKAVIIGALLGAVVSFIHAFFLS